MKLKRNTVLFKFQPANFIRRLGCIEQCNESKIISMVNTTTTAFYTMCYVTVY